MIRFARIPSFRKALLVGALALCVLAQVTAPVAEASRIRQVDLDVVMSFDEATVEPHGHAFITVRAGNNGPEFSSGRVDVILDRRFRIVTINGNGMNCTTKADHFFDQPMWKVSCTRSEIRMWSSGGEKILIAAVAPKTPADYGMNASVVALHTEDTNPKNNSFGLAMRVVP